MSRPRRARVQAGAASSRSGSFLRELLIVVVGALVISSLLRAFLGQMFIIPSGSMEHTLDINDRVAVSKIGGIERGEVVVFADPGGWLRSSGGPSPTTFDKAMEFVGFPVGTTTDHLIKRVIGLPGDHVVCCDTEGRITVNDHALDESAYLYRDGDAQVRPSETPFDVVVPAGRIWVLGDHRNSSADSRCHLQDLTLDGIAGSAAFVPESDVVGPAFAIALPLGRARILHVPDTFADVPDPTGSPPAEPVINDKNASC